MYGRQWNFGYKSGYFDNIISKIKNIDENKYNDLIYYIEEAKELANYALNQLNSGKYTYEYKYVSKFGCYNNVYTLTNASELNRRYNNLYSDFSNWIGSYEM